MDIEILAQETLDCYPGLEERVVEWAELSLVSTNGLLLRMLNGSLIEEQLSAGPSDRAGRRAAARYKPPRTIEIDFITDKPRWGLLAFYFFHELGHHKDMLNWVKCFLRRVFSPYLALTFEESANGFAFEMMKRVGLYERLRVEWDSLSKDEKSGALRVEAKELEADTLS